MGIISGGVIISGGKVIEGAGGTTGRPLTTAGAPVNGISGSFAGAAAAGARLVRLDTGALYTNTNTQASPTWTAAS